MSAFSICPCGQHGRDGLQPLGSTEQPELFVHKPRESTPSIHAHAPGTILLGTAARRHLLRLVCSRCRRSLEERLLHGSWQEEVSMGF